MTVHFVTTIDEVLELALQPKPGKPADAQPIDTGELQPAAAS
jgi:hypothetical protein